MEHWVDQTQQTLKQKGILFGASLPDNVLSPLIQRLDDDRDFTLIKVTREEEGIGILAGNYLGGSLGVLLMQVSGLGNCINALTSLCIPQRLPLLMIISQRGELGEFNYSQITFGRTVEHILRTLGVQNFKPSSVDEFLVCLKGASEYAVSTRQPVAIFLTKACLGEIR